MAHRLNIKLSTAGIDVDAGTNKRVSDVSTAGASIVVGMQVSAQGCGGCGLGAAG